MFAYRSVRKKSSEFTAVYVILWLKSVCTWTILISYTVQGHVQYLVHVQPDTKNK